MTRIFYNATFKIVNAVVGEKKMPFRLICGKMEDVRKEFDSVIMIIAAIIFIVIVIIIATYIAVVVIIIFILIIMITVVCIIITINDLFCTLLTQLLIIKYNII